MLLNAACTNPDCPKHVHEVPAILAAFGALPEEIVVKGEPTLENVIATLEKLLTVTEGETSAVIHLKLQKLRAELEAQQPVENKTTELETGAIYQPSVIEQAFRDADLKRMEAEAKRSTAEARLITAKAVKQEQENEVYRAEHSAVLNNPQVG